MMTDEDLEKLSLYVDNALPADEAAAVAARITADAEWATAYRTMRRSGEMMRAHADATVAAVDAEALFARVNAELDHRAAGAARAAAVQSEGERPGLLRWLSTLLSPPVMLGMAGVAAATAFFVLRQSAPETPPEGKSALVGLTPPAPMTQVAQKPVVVLQVLVVVVQVGLTMLGLLLPSAPLVLLHKGQKTLFPSSY